MQKARLVFPPGFSSDAQVALGKLLCVAMVAAGLGLGAGAGRAAESPALPESVTRRLPSDGPGIAIQARRQGRIVGSWAFGLADRTTGRPVTIGTPFRIGSVSKQFTAAAVLRLAEQGKLSLDDPLDRYFPGLPEGGVITLRLMLRHRSGLADYTAWSDFSARVVRPVTVDEIVGRLRQGRADFPPGAKFAYSNSNYLLLGAVVEKVSGATLDDFLRRAFFEPLGLESTGVFRNDRPPPGMAKGYSFVDGKLVDALDWDMTWAGGAGALYSTVGDLCLWTEALHSGRVLTDRSLAEMLAGPEGPEGAVGVERYGFGLYHAELRGLPTVGHNGGLHGFLSRLTWFPNERTVIAVLGNSMPPQPGAVPAVLMERVAGVVLREAVEKAAPRVDPTVDPAGYPAFAGRYDFPDAVMKVSVRGEKIFLRLSGQKELEMFPSGRDAFFVRPVDARLTFERDGSGRVVAVRNRQNGEEVRAPRLDEAVTLTEEDLRSYTGDYQYGPLAVLKVTLDDGQLFAQLTGQGKAPIFPETATRFVWKIVPAAVEFQRTAEGSISGAVHTQNGISFFAPKVVSPGRSSPSPKSP